jgi:hypothetical protein
MKFGKLNAILVYMTWISILVTLAALLTAFVDIHANEDFILLPGAAILVFGVAHMILGYFVRCPNCNRCITVQGFKEPHPDSDGGWENTVLKWFSGRVRCIHCGRSVRT